MSNKHTDTIDEILRQVAIMHDPRSEKEAKAALSAMVAEIIGEDVPITKLMRETVPVEQINHLDSANLIRRAQRKTAIAKGFTL